MVKDLDWGDVQADADRMMHEYNEATYRKAYRLGWAASGRASDLDGAESRYIRRHQPTAQELEAWTDGWLDYAAGREKWHLLYCERHDNGEGGCGVA